MSLVSVAFARLRLLGNLPRSLGVGKRHAGAPPQRPPGTRDKSSVSRSEYTGVGNKMMMAPLFCFFRFVFDNYTWARDGPEHVEYNGKLIPARIPLSAIISGASSLRPYSFSRLTGVFQVL